MVERQCKIQAYPKVKDKEEGVCLLSTLKDHINYL